MKIDNYLTDLKIQQKLLADYLTSAGVEASEADLLNVLVQKIYVEGTAKVFHAGQLNIISSAQSLRGNVSAPNVVAVSNISPVEHPLKVWLDTPITDNSTLTLLKYRSNLFNPNKVLNNNYGGSAGCSILEDGSINVFMWSYGNTWISKNFRLPEWLAGHAVTISGEWYSSYTNKGGIRVCWVDKGGYTMNNVIGNTPCLSTSGETLTTVVPPKPEGAAALVLLLYANTKYKTDANLSPPKRLDVVYTNVQLALGDTLPPYEPYIEPEVYPVNADGTVENIVSLYPCTTLATDTKDVIINVEYIKDIDKAFAELATAIAMSGGE